MERIELQVKLGEAVKGKMSALGIPMDADHTRRFVRVCLRMAARVFIDLQAPPQAFLALAMACFEDELKAQEPSPVPSLPTASDEEELN